MEQVRVAFRSILPDPRVCFRTLRTLGSQATLSQ